MPAKPSRAVGLSAIDREIAHQAKMRAIVAPANGEKAEILFGPTLSADGADGRPPALFTGLTRSTATLGSVMGEIDPSRGTRHSS